MAEALSELSFSWISACSHSIVKVLPSCLAVIARGKKGPVLVAPIPRVPQTSCLKVVALLLNTRCLNPRRMKTGCLKPQSLNPKDFMKPGRLKPQSLNPKDLMELGRLKPQSLNPKDLMELSRLKPQSLNPKDLM